LSIKHGLQPNAKRRPPARPLLPTNGILPGEGQRRYGNHYRIAGLRACASEQEAYDFGQYMRAITARYNGHVNAPAESYCESVGFGFISAPGQPDVFFHASDLMDLAFDETLQERRVRFQIVTIEKGSRAKCIQAAG
jgi:cold shock CspA family protein